MDIICASICYRGYAEDEVAATLEMAPRIGYEFMEIHGPMAWNVEAVQALDADDLCHRLLDAGIAWAGIYPPNWGGADEADVEAHAEAIVRCACIVAELCGRHISTTGASRRDEPGGLERVAACVGRVLELVPADSPVKLTLEPHYGNVLQEPEDFSYILDAYPDPRLGLCVDTGHFHSAGVDTVETIHRFAPRVYAVHLKDHIGTTSVGIGRGEIDLAAVIGALRDVDYEGDLTIELEVDDPENLPRYAQEAYVYVSGLLGTKL